MKNDEPLEPGDMGELSAELTIWATPAVIDDPTRPDLGAMPMLTLIPSITVHTSDDHPWGPSRSTSSPPRS